MHEPENRHSPMYTGYKKDCDKGEGVKYPTPPSLYG